MKIKLFTLVAAMMVSLTSFAQFSQSKGSSSSEVSKGWNSVYVQYNNLGTSYSLPSGYDSKTISKTGLSKKLNAFSIGYNRAINVAPSIPLYIEVGAALQYAFYSDKCTDEKSGSSYKCTDNYKLTGNIFTVKVPVSVLYHIAIPNSDFAIEPYAGVDFKYHISGSGKQERNFTETYNNNTFTDEESNKVNIFDKNECNGHQAKRFQAGWHVGVNFAYKKAFVGVSYGQDFSKFQDDVDLKFKTFSATLGYRF